ncbi:MAG: 6-phosphofructokinase [Proteobacteria bacterium]|nr:MAG: 6-phosphofructokinase [Pseudomonadota bacterium]
MATFGIVVGGGPAPGINGVIGAAATVALKSGARVVGCLDGFKWLMEGDTQHVRELTLADVGSVHLRGGSILHTSRANPTKKAETLEAVVKSLTSLGVDHLITIGGDDTAFSARRVAEQADGRIKVAHVPKTIDNDLPLPAGIPTFGYETARELATTIVENLIEDCETTGRWFFVVVMGRKSGSLALGTGKSAGAPITVIPEEFPDGTIHLEDVVRTIEGAIVKRLAFEGRADGVAVIAEGVAERFDQDELDFLKDVPRDEHGHIRLAEVPLGKLLKDAVGESLAARGVKIATGEKDVGYELRCHKPTAFDRDYTRDLGAGAVFTLLSGTYNVLITRRDDQIVPVPFSELMDAKTGKTRVRDVDTGTNWFRAARALQTRVEQADLDDPKRLEAIAKAAKLSPDEAKKRYAPIAWSSTKRR